jgi:hypothetical protein
MIQPVSRDDLYNYQVSPSFTMIDNYVYLYHTKTLVPLPLYPDSIQDSMTVNFNETPLLSRSAPIYSFTNSGPRSFQVEIPLHRDMMTQIDVPSTALTGSEFVKLSPSESVDWVVNQLQSMALPAYAVSEKMVDPPLVAVRFGNDIFCKGVLSGPVSATYSGPILVTNKYALVTVAFNIVEVDPYDAHSVATSGGFRGLSASLERRIHTRSS